MRVLVTGAGGQLGADLVDALAGRVPPAGRAHDPATGLLGTRPGCDVVAADHGRLDVTDRDAVRAAVAALRPDVIVHTAAWTAVDACEADPDRAYAVNALGTRHVAEAARHVGSHVAYVSTDYVFDGTSPVAYRSGHEMLVAFRIDGPICPGKTNSDGLMALRISGPPAAMRTEWCSGVDSVGAPIVTTSDDTADPIVWIVGAEGDERLHGFRGDNGQELFTGDPLPGLRHFVTILAAAGRLYVAGDGRIFAFGVAH